MPGPCDAASMMKPPPPTEKTQGSMRGSIARRHLALDRAERLADVRDARRVDVRRAVVRSCSALTDRDRSRARGRAAPCRGPPRAADRGTRRGSGSCRRDPSAGCARCGVLSAMPSGPVVLRARRAYVVRSSVDLVLRLERARAEGDAVDADDHPALRLQKTLATCTKYSRDAPMPCCTMTVG